MHQLSLLIVPADAWLVALVETSLRLSVILLVAGAIAMVLRRSSANLRHLVWALALAGALLLPLGASYLPTLSLPVPRPVLAFARTADGVLGVRLSETQSPVPAGVMVEGTDDAVVLTVVPARGDTPERGTGGVGGRPSTGCRHRAGIWRGPAHPAPHRGGPVVAAARPRALAHRCRGPAPQNRCGHRGHLSHRPVRRAPA